MTTSAGTTRTDASRAWNVLDNPVAWETVRRSLNLAFGLYRRRFARLERWGLLDGQPSVLDVGCGIGQYAGITEGRYLGVDLTARYIDWAGRRNRRPNREFRCIDVAALTGEDAEFDLVLMVDFLHHLDDDACDRLLATVARLARRHVVSFEPVTWQPRRVGRLIVRKDRGDHVRSRDEWHAMFARSPLTLVRDEPVMLGPIHTRGMLLSPG